MSAPACTVQGSGRIELYFYGELPPAEQAWVETHLAGGCSDCREALADLREIEVALAARPDISAPPGGDWSAFTARLARALEAEPPRAAGPSRGPLVQWLAAAALVALVTVSVFFAARAGREPLPDIEQAVRTADVGPTDAVDRGGLRVAANYGEQHFERSKLVLLGLASKDAGQTPSDDWQFERELASRLLADTKIYRLAAEEQGRSRLAGVMRDLEFVLLQTAMTEGRDGSDLSQIQRAIQKRDLLHKMDLVRAGN